MKAWNSRRFGALLLASASSTALPSLAAAQTSGAADVGEVVVTGSRVITNPV